MSKTICPYCGNEMNYITRAIRGSMQIAYFQCPNCKTKSPQVNAPFVSYPLADLEEEAAKSADLKAGMTKAAADEIAELRDQTYNLTLYLNDVEKDHPDVFAGLMDKFDGMPGYSEGVLNRG